VDTSSLLNDLTNQSKEVKYYPCKTGRLIEALTGDEHAALVKAIDLIRLSRLHGKNRSHSSVWLAKVLRKNGYSISVSTIQRHVNKECSCDQSEE
jgi:hypothetical protein